VVSYDGIDPQPTVEQRAKLNLWEKYFAGGMSSVLFQNVREFRSLAYSTSGQSVSVSRAKYPQEPLAFFTATGTQADKTMEAIATIDSLLHQMPMKEENLEAARQSVLNSIQNNYPTFRNVGNYVANLRMNGYTYDIYADDARLIPTVSMQDVIQFHQQNIANNQNRIWLIIGDKKLTDLKALAHYGKVVELKKEDIIK
jgi:predicted Zn-dependent peptidase